MKDITTRQNETYNNAIFSFCMKISIVERGVEIAKRLLKYACIIEHVCIYYKLSRMYI